VDTKSITVLPDLDCIPDEDPLKEDLIDMLSKEQLKQFFEITPLTKFWFSEQIREAYPGVASKAIPVLVTFVTSYLCEAGFSAMMHIKKTEPARHSWRNASQFVKDCTSL
jgi:hypothetical protein